MKSLNKVKKTTSEQIKRSDSGLSGKGIVTVIDVSTMLRSILRLFTNYYF